MNWNVSFVSATLMCLLASSAAAKTELFDFTM
jgi:hypothetical protein